MERRTARRWRKVVVAHFVCAFWACLMALSTAVGVDGLMKPRNWPVAGA
jgi:hypothetical protein